MSKIVKETTVKITDNSAKFIKAMKEQVEIAMIECGIEAENYASRECPVDTGRLKNSITYATKTAQGEANTDTKKQAADPQEYAIQQQPEANTMYIGTNVKYAPQVELLDTTHKTGKAHFLRDAIANHRDQYKKIIEKNLKT